MKEASSARRAASLLAPPTPAQMFHTFHFIRDAVENVTLPCDGGGEAFLAAEYLHGTRENDFM